MENDQIKECIVYAGEMWDGEFITVGFDFEGMEFRINLSRTGAIWLANEILQLTGEHIDPELPL